jgi:HTH-type transcriptional regulator/antitoxin HigA
MTKAGASEYTPDSVSPPGETLLEILEDRGMTQAEFAERTGRPKKTINEIVKGKAAITSDTALQFERVLGVSAVFWSNRERRYREHLSRLEERERLSHQVEWLEEFPFKWMASEGWTTEHESKVDNVRELLGFFAIASPDRWAEASASTSAALRCSKACKSDPGALAAWLRKGELAAQEMETDAFGRDSFRRCLSDARALTRERPKEFVPELKCMCAEAGVAVVFVKQPPESRVSGAARWLTPSRALIQLSLRYKANDQLWFSFFHEAGHILLHGKREFFLDLHDARAAGEEEEEADAFAADILIPRSAYRSLLDEGTPTRKRIVEFASDIGVSPDIVLGRLQHDRRVPFDRFNDLKRSVRWAHRAR